MKVRLTQLDGKLPNLALMRLSAWHKTQGDDVALFRTPHRGLFEPAYDLVYGSAIFATTGRQVARLIASFPTAIVGGSWNATPMSPGPKIEDIIGDFDGLDYDLYPEFEASIGYTQRGCRFKCGFCSVPWREGRNRSVSTVANVWRGEPHPRQLHLLDNDFFGQPKTAWKSCLAEMRDGGFEVCFNQGVNVRVITDEIAAELATVKYRDDGFKEARLYTAWDSLGEETLFMRGVDKLEAAGISPRKLMVYMLVGFDPDETWAAVFRRFNAMVERGIKPYVMVYMAPDCDPVLGEHKRRHLPLGGHNARIDHRTLGDFQRWVNGWLYRKGVDFSAYDSSARRDPLFKLQTDLFEPAE